MPITAKAARALVGECRSKAQAREQANRSWIHSITPEERELRRIGLEAGVARGRLEQAAVQELMAMLELAEQRVRSKFGLDYHDSEWRSIVYQFHQKLREVHGD